MASKSNNSNQAKNLNEGHRERMYKKLINANEDTFCDYELLEMLMFFAIPRRDVKKDAKEMILRYSGLHNIIKSAEENLLSAFLVDKKINKTLLLIKLVKLIFAKSSMLQASDENIFENKEALICLLNTKIGFEKKENFLVCFLNSKNRLMEVKSFGSGSIAEVSVYPEEIARKAFSISASSIILCHNHPSGDVSPSNQDMDLTLKIKNACKSLNIRIADHIIVGGGSYFSFQESCLLDI